MKKAAQATPNQRLSREREQRGWSQQEVADHLGTTPVNVSRWERGLTTPGPYFRRKLCALFGKPAKVLGLVDDTVGTPGEQGRAAAFPEQAAAPLLATSGTALWHVPHRRNPFFAGREDVLQRLYETLAAGGAAALPQALAISGLGGIGKTQVALEYAYRYRSDYRAVLWVRADSREVLAADLADIADLLHLPEATEQDRRRAVEGVRRWLHEQSGWLLILDNADDLEMVSAFLPSGGTGHVILTTRAQATGLIAQGIALEQMGPEEGALFLLRRAKLIARQAPLDTTSYAEWTKAKTLVQLLGGLPLALDQAGAYLEETACGLSGYLDLYKRRRAALLRRRGRLVFDHPEPVAATWSLAFEQVRQIHPAAVELLRVCAFLHPDAIPEELLNEGAAELGPVLAPVASDPLELDMAIEALRRYSLVRRSADSHLLTIHRLVQAVLIDQMDEQVRRRRAERAVRAVHRAFPTVEFTTRQRCQRCFPHALACAALIEQWDMVFPEAAQLLNRAGNYLRERGRYQEAEPLLKQALAIYEQSVEPDHPDMASCLNDLATLYWNQGKYAQAEALFQQALSIREHTLGLEHLDVASSLNDLALLYWEQGHYAQAEPLSKRALAIREQTLGPEHPATAETLNNRGILSLAQGRYAAAEALLQRSLAIWERALGPDHPQVAYSLNNLAFLYHTQARYREAEPLYQRALAIREQALGPEHDEVAYTRSNLALLYTDQGHYGQAEPLLQQALTAQERALGPEHPLVAKTLHRLAKLSLAQGNCAQAKPLLMRSLVICEQSFGVGHPDVASSLDTLALLSLAQGHYEQAESLCQRALKMREQALGPGHPEVAISLNTLAEVSFAQGKYDQVEPLLRRVLSILEETLGPAHPEVVRCLELYARLLRATGRHNEAAKLDARARADSLRPS
jgi:tetratricopeptide (TPR) repeat protein/transcriptional regulator with XRE-family HTH domain